MSSKSIQHISIAQNKISGDQIELICNSLRNNKIILSLDLRWNKIGTKGAQMLKNALINNQTLLYIDLGGNNINEETQEAIEKIVQENLRRNPIPRDRIFALASQQQSNIQNGNSQFQQQSQLNYQIPNQERETVPMLSHLENVLEKERAHTIQIKQRLEAELEELQRKDRNDLRTIQEFENKCADLNNQNRMLKFDIERLREEFIIIEKNNIEYIKTHEERLRSNDFLIHEMQKKHANNLDKIIQENNFRIRELVRDWEGRCKQLEERVRIVESEGQELELELKRVQEKKLDLQVKHDEELIDLAQRVEENENNKYISNLNTLESKIKAIENGKDYQIKRNQELAKEYEERDIKASVELRALQEELQDLKGQNQEFNQKNNEFKILAEKLKNDLELKTLLLKKFKKKLIYLMKKNIFQY
ncbi:leucine rich repeat protein [Ichthyophthirius multifiliis]|uniref:Leucine rich repeat protein n=1 Tax=Ichthyophthirius multifiliis TaxID=5932 RepID=G0R1S9_ICHMU|nr:leucine rich repeat protein [Ichthyophthirius multifiliis]EGR28581.1 leucine rich repeat protein [Ichthyophthirius multifiliis]|eukprot:XP_004029817.1 leucine rich repeat protein [Ichthyophthirius multifiliis]